MDKKLTLDRDEIETVNRFSHLGDICSNGGEIQEAVTSKIRFAVKSSVTSPANMQERHVTKNQQNLIQNHVGRTLSYGAKCWAMKRKMKEN